MPYHDPVLDMVVAYLSSRTFEWLKASPAFPWVAQHTTTLNHLVMALWSFATSMGLSAVYTSAQGGTLTINGIHTA